MDEWWIRLGLRSPSYDPTSRSVVLNRPFDKKAHDRQNTLF
ncbi:hypothetical protein D1AOALGA4SA_1345, partial [Olavius algarvensis Delta 1 endosymbiont]